MSEYIGVPGIRVFGGHVAYTCPGRHDNGGGITCQFCEGGLFSCILCRSFEGATTTHCPGEVMDYDTSEAVYSGDLDFQDGKWIQQLSINAPGGYRRCDLPEHGGDEVIPGGYESSYKEYREYMTRRRENVDRRTRE